MRSGRAPSERRKAVPVQALQIVPTLVAHGVELEPASRFAPGFSLLRLSVPGRLAIAVAATLLLWLCVAWALA